MAAVNHFYAEELTVKTTSSTSYTNDADTGSLPTILGSALAANTKYLIIASAKVGVDNVNRLAQVRIITADDTLIAAKSEAIIEPTHSGTNTGHPYLFVHSYSTDATPADIEFEFLTPVGSDVCHMDQISLFLMDLDDLGSSNYFETVSADPGASTDLYPNNALADEWTIAGSDLGTNEFAVFAYQRTQVGSQNTRYVIEAYAADDGSTSARRGVDRSEGEDNAELRMSGFAVRHKASSGTPNFAIRTDKTGGNYWDRGGYGIALLVSAFADFPAPGYTAADTLNDTTERTMATITSYSPTTTADHLLFGMYTQDDLNAGEWARIHIEDDTVPMRVGDEPGFTTNNYDNNGDPQVVLFHMDNILSSDTSTYTLRATTTNANTAFQRWLLILSLELSAAGGAIVKVEGETVQVTEDDITVLDLVRLANETIQIVEGDITVLGLVRQEDETIQIPEGDIPIVGLIRVEGETVEIPETDLHFLGKVKVEGETVQIPEGDIHVIGVIRVEDEIVQIPEGDITVLELVRIEGETEQISEDDIRVMALVRLENETVQIPEGTIKIVGLIRQEDETVQIVEGNLHFLGQVKLENETLQMAEGDLHFLGKVKVDGETVQISEGDIHTLNLLRLENETEELSELDITVRDLVRIENEIANIVEAVITTLDLVKIESDTVQITEVDLHLLGLVKVELEISEISEGDIRIVVTGDPLGTTRLTFRAKIATSVLKSRMDPVFKSKIEHKFKG